jgi:hypothetical protein
MAATEFWWADRSVVLEISHPGSTPLNAVEETKTRALPGRKTFVGLTGIPRTMQITDSRLLNLVQTLKVMRWM